MALNTLVSVIGCFVARSGRKRGNRQKDGRTTDRDGRNDITTTVTLAANARRGLMKVAQGVSYTHARYYYTYNAHAHR